MELNDIQLPEKHDALVELEARHRKFRAERSKLESQIRRLDTALSRLAVEGETETEAIAERLADGTLAEIPYSELPLKRADLQGALDIAVCADQKVFERLARERHRYENRIIRAFRPAHRAAVRRIDAALAELIAANKVELEVRQACPVALVRMDFPNVGGFDVNTAGPARYWRQNAERLGFFEPDEPGDALGAPAAPKRKRRLFANRGNGVDPRSSAPALAAKGAD